MQLQWKYITSSFARALTIIKAQRDLLAGREKTNCTPLSTSDSTTEYLGLYKPTLKVHVHPSVLFVSYISSAIQCLWISIYLTQVTLRAGYPSDGGNDCTESCPAAAFCKLLRSQCKVSVPRDYYT